MTINNLQLTIYKKVKCHMSNVTGFTLVELLIVIAIIGVLTTLLMANFIGVRQRARDAQRKSDVRQIQAALELYRSDQGIYPSSLPSCKGQLTSPDGTVVYMRSVPCDPLYPNYYNEGKYWFSSTSGCDSSFPPQTGYHITVCLENKNDSQGRTESWGGGCSTQHFLCTDSP